MMKKVLSITLCLIVFVGLFISTFTTMNVSAANRETLGFYEQKLAQFKKEAEKT